MDDTLQLLRANSSHLLMFKLSLEALEKVLIISMATKTCEASVKNKVVSSASS